MEKILFINSCYNEERSRTLYLTKKIFEKFNIDDNFDFEEIKLKDLHLLPLSEERISTRINLTSKNLYDVESVIYSKKILSADIIVISAPFYDFSYPSMLKVFLENVSIPNLMYKYSKDKVIGGARGRKMIYITTRGGVYKDSEDSGYHNLAKLFELFGVKESQIISFNGTDFMENPLQKIDELVESLDNPF